MGTGVVSLVSEGNIMSLVNQLTRCQKKTGTSEPSPGDVDGGQKQWTYCSWVWESGAWNNPSELLVAASGMSLVDHGEHSHTQRMALG